MQGIALREFHQISQFTYKENLERASINAFFASSFFSNWIQNTTQVSPDEILTGVNLVLELFGFTGHGPKLLRYSTSEKMTAEYGRLQTVRTWMCSIDPNNSEAKQIACRKEYEKGFQGEKGVSARLYYMRVDGVDLGKFHEEVIYNYIDEKADLAAEGQILHDYFISVGRELELVKRLKFKTY